MNKTTDNETKKHKPLTSACRKRGDSGKLNISAFYLHLCYVES